MSVLVPEVRYVDNRDEFIQSYVKEKVVCHIGAADAPYAEKKFNNGDLLHPKLDKAKRLIAVDLDEESNIFFRSKGYEAYNSLEQMGDVKLDLIVATEIVEHVYNLVDFLSDLRKVCSEHTELLITTPNPFSIKRTIEAFSGYERYHPDHLSYISYTNLLKAFSESNFEAIDFMGTCLPKQNNSKKNLFGQFMSKRRPLLSETIMVIGKPIGEDYVD